MPSAPHRAARHKLYPLRAPVATHLMLLCEGGEGSYVGRGGGEGRGGGGGGASER
uniref:Uncharacterized protein n=1 Tax=Arundo donax TaxID=35708 RepID=A0A0A8Z3E1_ARUDO